MDHTGWRPTPTTSRSSSARAPADPHLPAGLGHDTVHVGRHARRVGRDARLRLSTSPSAATSSASHPTAAYAGRAATPSCSGVFFADEGQHLEHRLFVDHEAPHCRSRVAYKGALQGEGAHTVWIGDVLIRAAAVGTDTYEINRNLLLTDGARADSVPNLEIETGEIAGAGHASATGRFDDEQLFYLQSRGIPRTRRGSWSSAASSTRSSAHRRRPSSRSGSSPRSSGAGARP